MKTTKQVSWHLNRGVTHLYVSRSLTKEQQFILELAAELLLDEAMAKANQKRYEKSIDEALDRRDYAEVERLRQEYVKLS